MGTHSRFKTLTRGIAPPIGAYEPLIELGRGGMGTASLARATGAGGFERMVVIKRLHPHLIELPEAVKRFLDEAAVAAAVQHANVVGTNQVGSDDNGYFLVLDYVEGGSLEDLVDRAALKRERVPPPIVLRIALDSLSGLAAAHTARDAQGRPLGILHRDVSLQNILVGRDGVARIADFGIAKSALASVSTDRNFLVGKLLYMPPEYLARRTIGPELDIYSLGMTLWIALTGVEPWPGASEAQLVRHILDDRLPAMASAGVTIAPQLEALVERACDPAAERRFRSAREMAEVIESIGRDTGWLSSHGEVASYVEALLGVDLERRREQIAAALVGRREAATPGEAVDDPGSNAPISLTRPRAGAPRRSIAAVGVAALALGALAATFVLRGRAPTQNTAAIPSVATDLRSAAAPPASRAPIARPEDSATEQLVGPPPLTPPHQSQVAAASLRPASRPPASAAPAAMSASPTLPPSPAPPPTPTPASAPTPAPAVAPVPAPGDGISTHNPYR